MIRWSGKGDSPAVTRSCRNRQEQTHTVTLPYTVDPERTLGRNQRGVQHHGTDAPLEGRYCAGYYQATRGVSNRGNGPPEARDFDVGRHWFNLFFNRKHGEVSWLPGTAGKIEDRDGPIQMRHEPIPEAGGRSSAVNRRSVPSRR
jgi:hypothetical protein